MLHHAESMRPVRAFLVAFALAACDRGEYSIGDARYDPAQLASSGGEVSLSDGTRLDFVITSDRYNQWDAARKGLSRPVSTRFGALLKPKSPTARTIERAVAYLEGDAAARQSIERAGMSVRDFVLMTVALEQQMQLATAKRTTALAPMRDPVPAPAPATIDTSYQPAAEARDSAPLDTAWKVDTSARRRDTVRPPAPRDTVAPKRDTLVPKRDTLLPLPPPPDSSRG
jgi:hypothetical protein